MEGLFKIHCSQIGKIMGQIGLTDAQKETLYSLENRNGKPRTEKQEIEYQKLIYKRDNPELSQTTKTYLHEWYAGDYEEIFSKYVAKGNAVENDLIVFMSDMLGIDYIDKNIIKESNEFCEGTCDVNHKDFIVDVKAPWNKKTLNDNIEEMNPDYKWQGIGYMYIYNVDNFILFYGLMDTPAGCNYGKEVIYSDLPDEERWIAYSIERNKSIEKEIEDRVLMCRAYLEEYHKKVVSKKGKINLN